MTARRAETSSFTHRNHWKYDVYLSFRGQDTRRSFVEYLYYSFKKRGIRTLYDAEDFKKGDDIVSSFYKAIQESRMAIIVFSKEYASSKFCLDELDEIYKCIHGNGRLVWPIFYDVEPSEVRHQRRNYGQALVTHKEKSRADEEKIINWKLALREVTNVKGSSCHARYDIEVIKETANVVFEIINGRDPRDFVESPFIRMAREYSDMVVTGWRFMGFGSSITGFICFALEPSFQKLFGRWNLLKKVVYGILSSMFSLFILFGYRFQQRFPRVFLLQVLVSFLVLLLTSLYSYYDDLAGNKDGETEGKGYRNILSLISFGSFALMSMSLSIQLQPGLEVGLSNFFLGCLVLEVMKKNFLEGLGVALLCFIVMIIKSYSDFSQEERCAWWRQPRGNHAGGVELEETGGEETGGVELEETGGIELEEIGGVELEEIAVQ